jgi:hypothetical protein
LFPNAILGEVVKLCMLTGKKVILIHNWNTAFAPETRRNASG